jgi:hypothetical protein
MNLAVPWPIGIKPHGSQNISKIQSKKKINTTRSRYVERLSIFSDIPSEKPMPNG